MFLKNPLFLLSLLGIDEVQIICQIIDFNKGYDRKIS